MPEILDFHEVLAEAGFAPADEISAFYDLEDPATETAEYFAERGWDALRVEWGDTTNAMTWVRMTEEGIDMMSTTMSGVIIAQARFDSSDQGLAWFAGAVTE